MQRTKIGYLTHTWNPIVMRCSPVSEGCKNCWHLRMAHRLKNNPTLSLKVQNKAYAGGKPVILDDVLHAVLRLKQPARIGVQFMGDLFHENVPDEFIAKVLYVARETPISRKHTYLILTKRPKRMLKMLSRYVKDYPTLFPLPNVWLGVSVEDQKTADKRIPLLLYTPAAVRFVSYEPALGPVDFEEYLKTCRWIDWIIMGGETGPGARPMDPGWARSVRDQCRVAGVPFWFKQNGEWISAWDVPKLFLSNFKREGSFFRVGSKRAGRLLDGREYSELPAERDNLNA